MSENTSGDTPSITDLAHQRGDDGELLPVTETVDVLGQRVEVDIIPATTGQQNEWRPRLETEGEELSDETVYDLLDEFAAHEPGDFGSADSWADVRPAITDALAGVIMAKLFDAEDTDEFLAALQDIVQDAAQPGAEGNEGAAVPDRD